MHNITLTPMQVACGRCETVRPKSSPGHIHVAEKRSKYAKAFELLLATPCHPKEGLHDLGQERQLLGNKRNLTLKDWEWFTDLKPSLVTSDQIQHFILLKNL